MNDDTNSATPDRPIGPLERAWLDAAEAQDRADALWVAALRAEGHTATTIRVERDVRGDGYARSARLLAEEARAKDAAAETWLVWETLESAGYPPVYVAKHVGRYRVAQVGAHSYSALVMIPPALGFLPVVRRRLRTLDDAKQACEDHARGRLR